MEISDYVIVRKYLHQMRDYQLLKHSAPRNCLWEKKMHVIFRQVLEDPGVDGRVGSSTSGMGDMDWIDLAQDWDRWRTLVNAIMNLWVP